MTNPQLGCRNKKLAIFISAAILQLVLLVWYFEDVSTNYLKFRFDKIGNTENIEPELSLETVESQEEFIEVYIDGAEKISLKHYTKMKKYNDLRITDPQNCSKENLKVNASGKFVVVTNFIYLRHKNYVGKLGDFVINDTTLEARIMEVISVLQSNLNHPFIEEVHVLVKEDEAIEYLRRLPLKNSQKLIIHIPEGLVSMKTQLEYAGECLMDKIVAIAHQDNQFGKGWEKLKPEILKNKRIVYALTRHTPEHLPCKGAKGFANCDRGYPYIGSHDVFMFHVKEKFDSSLLADIKGVTPNLYGMENLLIWVFDKKLNYRILNPCLILYVHHHHCIPIRDMGRKRVDKAGASGAAGFTDRLEP